MTLISQGMGFCIFNNAAIATQYALQHEQTSSSSQQENRSYLEDRLATIGEQINAVRHSTDAMTERAEISASDVAKKESREVEQRVASMIGEARELMLKSAPSGEMLGSIRSEIESLNQRFDDIMRFFRREQPIAREADYQPPAGIVSEQFHQLAGRRR